MKINSSIRCSLLTTLTAILLLFCSCTSNLPNSPLNPPPASGTASKPSTEAVTEPVTKLILDDKDDIKPDPKPIHTHHYECIAETQVSCSQAGTKTMYCEGCGDQYVETTHYAGHLYEAKKTNFVGDDGQPHTASYQCCSRCKKNYGYKITELCELTFEELPDGARKLSVYQPAAINRSDLDIFCIPDSFWRELNVAGFADGFCYPHNLDALRIPSGISQLSAGVFRNATKLQVLILPNSLTEIASGAFPEMTSLRVVFFCGTEEQWKAVTKHEYAARWAGKLVFCPDGVSGQTAFQNIISDGIVEELLWTQQSTDRTQAAAEKLVADDSRITLLDERTITAVAVDPTANQAAVCGPYEGGNTVIMIYDLSTGQRLQTITVADHIHAIDFHNGKLAYASRRSLRFYVYEFASNKGQYADITTLNRNEPGEHVADVFIDGDLVFAVSSNAFCTLVCYNTETETLTKIANDLHYSKMEINREKHRLVVLNMNGLFINTQTGAIIKTVYEGFYMGTVYPSYIINDMEKIYDWNGNLLTEAPEEGLAPDVESTRERLYMDTIYKSDMGSAAIVIDNTHTVSLVWKPTDGTAETVIRYYAKEILPLTDGNILFYAPEAYGLFLANIQ